MKLLLNHLKPHQEREQFAYDSLNWWTVNVTMMADSSHANMILLVQSRHFFKITMIHLKRNVLFFIYIQFIYFFMCICFNEFLHRTQKSAKIWLSDSSENLIDSISVKICPFFFSFLFCIQSPPCKFSINKKKMTDLCCQSSQSSKIGWVFFCKEEVSLFSPH